MTVDAPSLLAAALDALWLALAVAIGVWVVAGLWVVARFVSVRLERRYLPRVARWSRRRAGVGENAGPWACPICHSVNQPTVARCYDCGVPRPVDAPELADAATDPSIFHRPAPVNRFDPALYRGPGPDAALPGASPDAQTRADGAEATAPGGNATVTGGAAPRSATPSAMSRP